MLSGEAGIGKTRLLEKLALCASAAGSRVAWGRMWEVALTPTFWPFIQVLAALEVEGDPAPLLGNLESRADASTRLARFGEVAAFLVRRARAAPLAILLDDLHAADPASLQLLEYLLPVLVGQRVLFALAARDSDGSPEAKNALGRIQRGARRLPLARLDREQVAQLVAARTDSRRVFELSEGNPLFVEELLAAATADGELRLPVLSSVRAVIRSRIANLPAPSRAALVAASVVGRDFRGQVVAQMLSAEDLSIELAPVRALGMVTLTSPDRYRFSHALIAEAIADELDAAERARLHLKAAHALERNEPSDCSAVAHHLLAAGHLAAAAAVRAAERAARQCMAQLAFENAAALLERALEALALAAPDDHQHRAQLLCELAEALQHASRHLDAAQLCERAAALARGADAPELLARIALAHGLEYRFGQTDPRLVALLEEAQQALGERDPALRAKLLARLAAAEQPARDPRKPVARALEAIALARALGPRDRLDVMYVASAALMDFLEPEPLEQIHREVLGMARGVDRTIEVHTHLRLCFSALARVDRRAFDLAVQTFAREAEALGLPRWTRQVHMLEALTALLEGRWHDAARAAEQFESIATALGDTSALWTLDAHRILVHWTKTEAPARALAAKFNDYARGRAALGAWLAMQHGERELARSKLDELESQWLSDIDLGCMIANAVVFLNDTAWAARIYPELAALSGRIAMSSLVGAAVIDLYDRLAMQLAVLLGQWDAAATHAQQALKVAARLGSPVWTARVQADWAEALRARGEHERARELWQQASAAAERLSLPGLLARCHSALHEPASTAEALPPSAAKTAVTLEPSGELWIVQGLGERVHVKSSRGMQILARLLSEPGRELHVLELSELPPGAQGDAGPVLDAQARAAYRARLGELNAERSEAERDADLARMERLDGEIASLQAELARAVGLSGRERRLGAIKERARSNVQRRLAHAIEQVRAASSTLGEHLVTSVRTGMYCSYSPPRSTVGSGTGAVDA
jgi:hypothetical protein